MLQSALPFKIRREAPQDEVAKNAQLLIRAGFVHKELAGVYSYLPLGLLTLNKINELVRYQMRRLGAQEVSLSALQAPEPWQKTGRWSDEKVDFWFKTRLKNQSEVGLGATHEEPLTRLLTEHLSSYRDLPFSVFQIQTKFRNETRAKSGLIRCREFAMKDLYSFSATAEVHQQFYEKVIKAYRGIFQAAGIGDRTYLTFASGGVFSPRSHEFQTLSPAGEDTIYVAADRGLAVNVEVADEATLAELGLGKDDLAPHKAIEVANIFHLGTRFSEALGLAFTDAGGKKQTAIMGSYGLGPTRLLGTVAEALSDERGLVWPSGIAPFMIHLTPLGGKGSRAVAAAAKSLYQKLSAAGGEGAALWDDRGLSAGETFASSDLLGLPYRAVISEKTLGAGKYEVRERRSGKTSMLGEAALIKLLKQSHGQAL